jgi:hypothetical protein
MRITTNNTVAAEMTALAMCRKDGGELYAVDCVSKQGKSFISGGFPYAYAKEFAATEIANGGEAMVRRIQ